jgi:shikimate kinase
VISLGGGTVLRDDNVASLLLTGVLLHLDAPPPVLVERLHVGADDRPLLAGDAAQRIRETHAERAPRYASVADATFDASQPPDDVAQAILEWAMAQGDVLTPSEHEQVMT